MKKLLALLLLSSSLMGQIKLSSTAQISVITCGPSQVELYSAFGHTAVRVADTLQDIDIVFNYGIFDYGQPNFYLNFAKGHLYYKLAMYYFSDFLQSYQEENRFVHEQVLNLKPRQVQRYFDFLYWNAAPENATYNYDYFYDNCATRVRDGLKKALGDSIAFGDEFIEEERSIRDLCDMYLKEQPWGDLGIDICLGLPMDKKANARVHHFLPDYFSLATEQGNVKNANGFAPLVLKKKVLFEGGKSPKISSLPHPLWFSGLLFVLLLTLSVWEQKKKRWIKAVDIVFFSLVGLLGTLLFVLWVATSHKAAAQNMNLLWAIPLHFPLVFLLCKQSNGKWLKWYFKLSALLAAILLCFWWLLPQGLNLALFPLVVALGMRAWLVGARL